MNSIQFKIRASLQRITDPVIRERLLMVQSAIKHPLRDAAREFGCAHGKIAYWKNRYLKLGLKGLYTKPRSGRPSKMKPEHIKLIKRKVRKHNTKQGWTTKHVRALIHKEAGVIYTSRHILRISQSWGLSQIKPRKRSAYSRQEDRDAFIKKTIPS